MAPRVVWSMKTKIFWRSEIQFLPAYKLLMWVDSKTYYPTSIQPPHIQQSLLPRWHLSNVVRLVFVAYNRSVGVKLLLHWGSNTDWGCPRTGCWGEYLGPGGMKWQDSGQNCTIRRSINWILHKILVISRQGGWDRRGLYHAGGRW
jgi:hypothetical protein